MNDYADRPVAGTVAMAPAANHIASNLAENEARLHELITKATDLKLRALGEDEKVANKPTTAIRSPRFSGMMGELDGLSCRIGDAIDRLEETLRTLSAIA